MKFHRRKVISEWLTSDKLPILQGIYRKVTEGEEDPALLIADVSEFCYACLFAKSTMAKTGLMQNTGKHALWVHKKGG